MLVTKQFLVPIDFQIIFPFQIQELKSFRRDSSAAIHLCH